MSRTREMKDPKTSIPIREVAPAKGADTERRIYGVVVGRLEGIDDRGRPVVSFPGDRGSKLKARSTVEVAPEDADREVAICFERGLPGKPVIMGFMWVPDPAGTGEMDENRELTIESGRDRVVIEADKEITLRCGNSSVTLTRAGKILLRGKYVSSHSSGVNRIKGGSVQIN